MIILTRHDSLGNQLIDGPPQHKFDLECWNRQEKLSSAVRNMSPSHRQTYSFYPTHTLALDTTRRNGRHAQPTKMRCAAGERRRANAHGCANAYASRLPEEATISWSDLRQSRVTTWASWQFGTSTYLLIYYYLFALFYFYSIFMFV